MKQKHSWQVTDGFWNEVKHLMPTRQRDNDKQYKRKPGGGRPPIEPRKALEAIFLYCAQVFNGKLYLRSLEHPALFTATFNSGAMKVSLRLYG